jgi:hypothetical protein
MNETVPENIQEIVPENIQETVPSPITGLNLKDMILYKLSIPCESLTQSQQKYINTIFTYSPKIITALLKIADFSTLKNFYTIPHFIILLIKFISEEIPQIKKGGLIEPINLVQFLIECIIESNLLSIDADEKQILLDVVDGSLYLLKTDMDFIFKNTCSSCFNWCI